MSQDLALLVKSSLDRKKKKYNTFFLCKRNNLFCYDISIEENRENFICIDCPEHNLSSMHETNENLYKPFFNF